MLNVRGDMSLNHLGFEFKPPKNAKMIPSLQLTAKQATKSPKKKKR